MKKIISLVLTLSLLAGCLTGCNYTLLDTKYHFDKAIITLPDGSVISGEVDKWMDYEGEQLQITIDGVIYLVSSYNAVLIREE